MTPTLDRINALTSPVARMLLKDLHDAWADAIVLPNSLLMASKHGTEVAEGYEELPEQLGQSISTLLEMESREETRREQERRDTQEFLGQKEERLAKYESAIDDDRRIEFLEYTCVIVNNTRQLLDAIGVA